LPRFFKSFAAVPTQACRHLGGIMESRDSRDVMGACRMSGTQADQVGFVNEDRRDSVPRRHVAALELMAGVGLVVCTAVAATVVSIGIARADTLAGAPTAGRSFAVALLLALVLAASGGVTALVMRSVPRRD
jgi:hypothetical protein